MDGRNKVRSQLLVQDHLDDGPDVSLHIRDEGFVYKYRLPGRLKSVHDQYESGLLL